MAFSAPDFVINPTVEALTAKPPKKDDWIYIAKHFRTGIQSGMSKHEIKVTVIQDLVLKNLLSEEALNLCDSEVVKRLSTKSRSVGDANSSVTELDSEAERDRSFQLEKLRLELELQKEKSRMELELQKEKSIMEERKTIMEERKLDKELELARLKIQSNQQISNSDSLPQANKPFDVAKVSRLVPCFDETDPEIFFRQFEKTATTLSWPRDHWTILIQTVLKGKGALVYANLSVEDSRDYDLVKKTVLAAYELTVEGYRQQFRNIRKSPEKTYVEFANEKFRLFKKWTESCFVNDFDSLCNLIIMEEFKRCIPLDVKLYLEDREITLLKKAAVTADSYSLLHKHPSRTDNKTSSHVKSVSVSSPKTQGVPTTNNSSDLSNSSAKKPVTCSYCKKVGHDISNCWSKNCKQSKHFKQNPSQESSSTSQPTLNLQIGSFSVDGFDGKTGKVPDDLIAGIGHDEDPFKGFKFAGRVSLIDSDHFADITILRDTGAAQSILISSCLPEVERAYTGERVLLKDLSGYPSLPLARISLESNLVSGPVSVGIVDGVLPVKDVHLLLGNDLAGTLVVPNPIVVDSPLPDVTLNSEISIPDTLPTCAVTRSQSKQISKEQQSHALPSDFKLLPLSKENLTKSQRSDPTLESLSKMAVEKQDLVSNPGYYFEDEVLMRRYRPLNSPLSDDWSEIHQIVVPKEFRKDIISLAHDGTQGHLGIHKTYHKILAHFYWPRLKSDVTTYIKTCHICQMVGKPNRPIPPAPLHPIPVVNEPFHKVLVDCVGPLPKTKKGNEYLLTVMCTMTRYPEAIPLRNIKSKTVINALLRLFTHFGIPMIIQHDQGSNFTSKLFSEVMNKLGVSQYCSTPYHPESQGAIERFHQTLKSMIKKFCIETQSDWDEGIPYLLFAIRESKNESLGYSPFELMFGREVRGPLSALKDSWLTSEHSKQFGSVSQYFEKLQSTLSKVHKIALDNLKVSQGKMKQQYDRKSKVRNFKPGDSVLVFLPISGGSLAAKYSGPYVIKSKVDDLNYIISTPDRRQKTKKVHVNLMKKYVHREAEMDSSNNNVSGTHPLNVLVPQDVTISQVTGEGVTFARMEDVDLPTKNSDVLENLATHMSHLTDNQLSDLSELFKKFPNVIRDFPGLCTVMKHDVVLKEGTTPIKQSPYRITPQKRSRMKDAVQYLLDNGLAEPCFSPWSSPCLLAPKPDGSDRLCTDYRKVNQVTVVDSYPLPRLDDLVDSVGSAQFVTKIDLQKGYYQILLTPNASEISAFVTPDGLYKYLRMPFGMRNAPSTFQRIINYVIADLDGVRAYLDDLLIPTDTWEEHLVKLYALFSRLSDAGLTINLMKCSFGCGTVTYLGHEVGQGNTKPRTAKVQAIMDFPPPSTRKSLMRFLGMAGFYRRFCPNFSSVVAPLTALLSPKLTYQWTEDSQQAFEKIKLLLSSAPVLKSPDHTIPFELHVDACEVAAGAVLLQKDTHSGILHPVCYFSSKFKKHQLAYSTIEKECLALILALDHFRYFVHDSPFPVCVRTDHNPLAFLYKMQNSNQRLMRWSMLLQDFNLTLEHIRGSHNVVADTLSRSDCA